MSELLPEAKKPAAFGVNLATADGAALVVLFSSSPKFSHQESCRPHNRQRDLPAGAGGRVHSSREMPRIFCEHVSAI